MPGWQDCGAIATENIFLPGWSGTQGLQAID